MRDEFLTFIPNNELVKKYISYYYFHQSFNDDFSKRYTYYPHYKNGLTVYKNAKVTLQEGSSYVEALPNKNFEIIYSMNFYRKIKVHLIGKINKIGIAFNPLGLNHFIDYKLSKISRDNIFRFGYYGKDFEVILTRVYAANNFEQKVSLLDAFFESKFNPDFDKRIVNATDVIINAYGLINSKEVAENISISTKTLLRLFNTHLNCSIEDYKKLVRFRNALNYYQSLENKPRLSDVAYDTLFYDQANFTNHFKSLVGLSPKVLFDSIEKLGNEDIYWTIS